jgi:hypothetical protein
MSKVTAIIDGFVGHDGTSVPLQSGDEYDSAHPLVQAHPELFTEPEPEPVKPAAKPATKATTAKAGAKDG